MKPLFKNITIDNSKIYKEFINFHDKKFGFRYNSYNIIIIILLLYSIFLAITNKQFLLLFLFIGMLAFIILFRIYLPIKRQHQDEKKYSENKENKISYEFYKYYFKIQDVEYYYYKLYKVFETTDYFYLYISEQTAFLISKNGFQIGTSQEFSNFIKKKCLLKYRKIKEKKSQ